MPTRPFRFMTSMPPLTMPVPKWRDEIRRIEDLGFDSVAISDHLTGGWSMDPIVAMTVAAEATTRLRVLAMVFCNDFRHPVLLHRSMANLDVVSGGRVEIGLGAGWQQADYQTSGIAFDPAPRRVGRLGEAVEVIRRLFAPVPCTFAGEHYRVERLTGLPQPVQRPHPPLMIGGGGRRILELAGRSADIVGVNPRLGAEVDPATVAGQIGATRMLEKLAWVRRAAATAGRDPAALEFQQSMLDVSVTHRGARHQWRSSLAKHVPPDALAASPAVLRGDLSECVDLIHKRREAYGISYLHLGGNLEAAAPLVARLAGQ